MIVGKKGSGKTIYLRRLQVSTREEDSVFSQSIQSDAPSTSQILQFCEVCEGEQVTEKWRDLWTSAILVSVLTHILHKKYFHKFLSSEKRAELKATYSSILPKSNSPLSPYRTISQLLSVVPTSSRYEEFINRPIWVDLKDSLSNILKDAPPIFYYLDAVDEEFAHAPMEWHQCQKGLFYSVMRMLREQGTLGGRLHVTICIRDIVFASILRSEHAGRNRNAPQICKLNWDTNRISYFFQQKVEMLPPEYFERPSEERSVANFFGIQKLYNKDRGIWEDVTSYIIRHTRFLPRDVVELGNELARAKLGMKVRGSWDAESWQEVIRKIVARRSRSLAEEQLTICANQLASQDKPRFSAKHGYDDFYTSGQEYISSKAGFLKKVIKLVGCEKFTREALNEVRQKISEGSLNEDVDIFSILWQNGLIACQTIDMSVGYKFFSLEDRDDFLIPEEAKCFAFHSCIMDSVNITIADSTPIIESEPF